ncbi:sulfotransferase family protein [Stieleria varia]|uniref:Sulfotransferase domain protein n=1 Tax=Stieleria varia TaxID=2528005 RepID=A0A5C6B946_9BACT|nr:sulfotransferase [Stieleria varia]TWU07961.1 Sulfotransferase domain protein [Stieleria varia]
MALPGLLIIGAQKCGTSTLHASLGSHRQVCFPMNPANGKTIKEMNYFGNLWDRGHDWYASHYQDDSRIALDSTPNYLCDIEAHERMAQVLPDARLIVSLRDPIARAYSQFNHYSQHIEVTRTWDWRRPGESLAANIQAELDEPKRRWYGLLARGYYERQLQHLLSFFPRERIHVMIMERWIADPDRYFDELLAFADLEPQELTKNAVHMRAYTVDPLDRDLDRQLREIYRPHNERLFEWLGESIDEWN